MQKNIIIHINRGDKRAFKEVFDHYFNALAAFASKYVSDQFVAEDLVQEAFISMWEKREDFSHLNALKSFLYTSVRNKCLNHIKHQSVVQKHDKALVYELESEQYFVSHVIEEETFNQLFKEIKDLPPSAREITLLALNGLKNQEIADELKISVNTVKTQKKIAYSRLKEKLGSHFTGILLYLF